MQRFLDKRQIVKRKKTIKKIVVLLVFIILCSFGFLTVTSNFFSSISRPIFQGRTSIANNFNNIKSYFNSKNNLLTENEKLIEDNREMKLQMVNYNILEGENNELKEMLNRLPKDSNFILGNILAKPNSSPYDTIIIDIGSKDGIKQGNVVYANGETPIGFVDKVYEKTSLITLYTNPGQKTEGFINGSNASVELVGRGGGNFEMIVPMELQIDNGGIVYLPGDNSLVVAIVNEVISEPTDPFKKVLLSSPVNIQGLKWTEISR